VAGGATEHGKGTHVPSRNTNADCFEERGEIFSAVINIYLKKQGIGMTTPDMSFGATAPIWALAHLYETLRFTSLY
jgi:hypothetical protein